MKTCIACGMPLKKAEDYFNEDTTLNYCVYCSKPDGSMQNYKEKLISMTEFIVKTQGLDPVIAKNTAQKMMEQLPAWKK